MTNFNLPDNTPVIVGVGDIIDKRKVEIGSFLNDEETEELISLLKKKVQDLNFL